MQRAAREFNCARCHRQVLICSRCDRGQIYCARSCSQAARRESLRAAGRRYQNSRRGRLLHAARQRCYRQRRAQKVTHQGSVPPGVGGLLRSGRPTEAVKPAAERVVCHFCGRDLSAALVREAHRGPDEHWLRRPWVGRPGTHED